jgi:ubiquinone/menaquinone biosynthesis C-methylase UbiE
MTDTDRTNLYYDKLVAAFIRGRLPDTNDLSLNDLIDSAASNGLRIHKFKRNAELPRVSKILGILRGLSPESLLDIGSGRGTFLWPMLDSFPYTQVTSAELNVIRATDVNAVRKGGIANISAVMMDAHRLGFADDSFDMVTALEVFEHMQAPEAAMAEAIRVARRFVLISVPSHEDDNPEHLHLFTKPAMERMLLSAGARKVKIEYVLNHMIAVAGV